MRLYAVICRLAYLCVASWLTLSFCICPTTANAQSAPAQQHRLTPSKSGFITAWMVARSVSKTAAERFITQNNRPKMRLRATSGPFVNLGKQPSKRQVTIATINLIASSSTSVSLRFGGDGHIIAYLDSKKVGEQTYAREALVDDVAVKLQLTEGHHRLTLLMRRHSKKRNRRWRIAARILDTDGSPPHHIQYALPQSADSPHEDVSAEAVGVSLHPFIQDGRTQVTIKTAVNGLTVPNYAASWEARADKKTIATGTVGTEKTVHLQANSRSTRVEILIGSRIVKQSIGTRKRWLHIMQRIDENMQRLPSSLPLVTRETLKYERDRLAKHIIDAIPETHWLNRELLRLEKLVTSAALGTDPLIQERGTFRRAYRSRFDASLQHYSIHVPKRYRGKRAWPLVVGLHGLGSSPHMALRQVLGKDRDKEAGESGEPRAIRSDMPQLPDRGVITVCPYAYGDTAYWFYGELDVLRVIEEVSRDYRIDPERIVLTGLSLGGLGTYHIGHHYPDRFAALGPLGGFSSVKLYRQIRKHPKTDWERLLINQRDATSYAENGKYTPMYVVHGEKDAPRHARAMTNRYKALRYRYALDIPEGYGHDVWQYSYGRGRLLQSLLRHRRPKTPDEIVFKTLSARYRSAYWATINWFEFTNRPAIVRGRVDRKRNAINITDLGNVRGLTLSPRRAGLSLEKPVTVSLPNGDTVTSEPKQRLHLSRTKGVWSMQSQAEPPPGQKRPGLSGPLDDIMFEPHRFVVGTHDPKQTDTNRRLVAEDRTYLRHRNHKITFPASDDVSITDDQIQSEHLVLYGNPNSNSVLRRLIAAGLPLSFDANGLTLFDRRYEGKDVGIKMIYPNPLAPNKYVVVVAGVSWRGTLLSRHLPRFLPDVVIYDERIRSRYLERILIDRPVLFGGFFDESWKGLKTVRQTNN